MSGQWAITAGDAPGEFEPFTPAQMCYLPGERRDRTTPLGWAPTVEEAWSRWEAELLRWAADAERQAARWRETVARMRAKRVGAKGGGA